jgi:hypothetical protein
MTRGLRSFRSLRLALIACALPALAAAQSGVWIKAGGNPGDYDAGVDPKIAFTGASSGFIRSVVPNPQTFGTYMQMVDATEYRGKRVRMTAQMKTDNVQDWSGLWLRIDTATRPGASFDNMQNRPVKGTNDWMPISIVLDVDRQATAMAFGVLLAGRGAAWVDDVSFTVVGTDVPVTDIINGAGVPPRNLDFESNGAAR